ncbi:hypothetical protein ASPZODRAFT_133790 [Penicilliopsis zonata CBS 506.65]|uniref:GH16 domain-containing protein n=1 Tax=Penicilliopsis zonata CBS 506.65 TaxID=1073090 RepID=A0A1L9SFM7_9EURO|nr:hypothetical protein ASPZODRAFT_133790 [Penicilliopsis zonata CBS 506.65]OJJ45923.1 hypothetical protein ASPZODRAFT_133790 [Penicilliopsis zonata CBS 506.65]
MSWMLLALAAASFTAAQTYTDCDPLDETCSADNGTTASYISYDLTQSTDLAEWTVVADTVTATSQGAEFTISEEGDAPTIETAFYIMFGEVSVTLKAAPGQGIVSSIVLESDDLDEVDWEILGSYTTKLQTDYYGKGDSADYDRWTWVALSNPQEEYYTYTWTWTAAQLTWAINGTTVRTLTYDEAVNGTRYPQTPCRVRIGIWAGGDPDNANGTIEWAGGVTDYDDGPYSMYVTTVDITNYNPAVSYTYTDETGDWESIELTLANGTTTTVSGDSAATTTSPAKVNWATYFPSAGGRMEVPTGFYFYAACFALVAVLF